MSRIEPIDETEYKLRGLWPAGWYAAQIGDAADSCVEKLSKSDNVMFETDILVFDETGKMKKVKTYIMASGKAAWQMRSAAEAFGVLEQYKAGTLTENDFKGRTGFVKLAIQEENGNFPAKNVIGEFKSQVPGKVTAADLPKIEPQTGAETAADLDDSIPF